MSIKKKEIRSTNTESFLASLLKFNPFDRPIQMCICIVFHVKSRDMHLISDNPEKINKIANGLENLMLCDEASFTSKKRKFIYIISYSCIIKS